MLLPFTGPDPEFWVYLSVYLFQYIIANVRPCYFLLPVLILNSECTLVYTCFNTSLLMSDHVTSFYRSWAWILSFSSLLLTPVWSALSLAGQSTNNQFAVRWPEARWAISLKDYSMLQLTSSTTDHRARFVGQNGFHH